MSRHTTIPDLTDPGQTISMTQRDLDQLISQKVSAAMTDRVMQEEQSRKMSAALESRREAIRRVFLDSINKISTARALEFLAKNGHGHLIPEPHRNKVSSYVKRSEEMAQELATEFTDGHLAQEEVADALLQAAAQDPVQAAELISDNTGTNWSPEDVEAAAEQVADATLLEEGGTDEMPEGEKTSAVKFISKVSESFAKLPPVTQRLLTNRAAIKIAQAQAEYRRQQEAQRPSQSQPAARR